VGPGETHRYHPTRPPRPAAALSSAAGRSQRDRGSAEQGYLIYPVLSDGGGKPDTLLDPPAKRFRLFVKMCFTRMVFIFDLCGPGGTQARPKKNGGKFVSWVPKRAHGWRQGSFSLWLRQGPVEQIPGDLCAWLAPPCLLGSASRARHAQERHNLPVALRERRLTVFGVLGPKPAPVPLGPLERRGRAKRSKCPKARWCARFL